MRKYEVPYNFDKHLIDELIPYKENVDFVYVPSFYQDGSNTRTNLIVEGQYPNDYEEYLTHIEYIKSNGFDVGILMQYEATQELIEKYYNLGIRIFVINDNELAVKLKEKFNDIKLILSITAIKSYDDICNEDLSMYDEIVLFFNFCRQLDLLEKLPKKYKYVLIVNSHCLYKCDRCDAHWTHKAISPEENIDFESKIAWNYCSYVYREDRAFIPPEDLIYFDDFVCSYKIVDRLDPTMEIIGTLQRFIIDYNSPVHSKLWYNLE